MITHSHLSFGPQARNRLPEASQPGLDGALAALETFYYALNQQDIQALSAVWSEHALAQLNNPLGGILRGGRQVTDLYRRIFEGPVRLEITFGDVVQYDDQGHAVFAGRETGTYTVAGGEPQPLAIRTTRYFRYDATQGRWLQYHHHGSIDDPAALAAYQHAVLGPARPAQG